MAFAKEPSHFFLLKRCSFKDHYLSVILTLFSSLPQVKKFIFGKTGNLGQKLRESGQEDFLAHFPGPQVKT